MWTRVASVHSQAEHDAIGHLIGQTAQYAFLGAERLDDLSWRWRDGTPWDFEAWDVGTPDNIDSQKFLVIAWEPGVGTVWKNKEEGNGVICEAPSISTIKGDIPTILRLGGPENAAMIAASEDL
jgi:hypothetical protein